MDVRRLQAAGPTLLVGSAVSLFDPTGLPTGNTVTRGLAEYLFPTDGFPQWLRTQAARLPFEAVVEAHPMSNSPSMRASIAEYFTIKSFNAIHLALARGLASGEIGAVITTNYDTGIENAADHEGISIDAVASDLQFESLMTTRLGPAHLLIKLHGSTELPDSLVYRVSDEAPLLGSKRSVLNDLIRRAPLVVLGYSGLDLDICPALIRQAHHIDITWIKRPGNSLSGNAAAVTRRASRSEVVDADLRDYLGSLLNQPDLSATPESSTAASALNLPVSDAEKRIWQMQVLDLMACVTDIVPNEVKPDPDGSPIDRELYLRRLGHRGRYRDLVTYHRTRRRKSKRPEDVAAAAIAEAVAWILYRNPIRAAISRRSAAKAFARVPNPSSELSVALNRLELTTAMRRASLLPIGPRTLHRAQSAYDAIMKSFDSGTIAWDWHAVRTIDHEAERLGLLKTDIALPPKEGYEGVGLTLMSAIAARDGLVASARFRNLPTQRETQEALQRYRTARANGWHHECWKLGLRLAKGASGLCQRQLRRYFRRTWKQHYKLVQYSPVTRWLLPWIHRFRRR